MCVWTDLEKAVSCRSACPPWIGTGCYRTLQKQSHHYHKDTHNTGSTAVQDLNPSNYISVSQDSPHKQSDYSTDFTTCYQTSGPVQKHRCFVAGRFIVFSNKDNTKLTCK